MNIITLLQVKQRRLPLQELLLQRLRPRKSSPQLRAAGSLQGHRQRLPSLALPPQLKSNGLQNFLRLRPPLELRPLQLVDLGAPLLH